MKKVVPLIKALEISLYGSKAVGLGDAARHGLPVPPGVALSGDLVEAIASSDERGMEKVAKAVAALPARSPFDHPPSTKTARGRASPASISPF